MPSANEPATDAPQIRWTDEARKKVHPARPSEGQRGRPPKIDRAKVRGYIVGAYKGYEQQLGGSYSKGTEADLTDITRAAVAWISAGAEGGGPGDLDPNVQAAAAVLLGVHGRWRAGIRALEKAFIEDWTAKGGAALAVDALTRTWAYRLEDYYGYPGYLVKRDFKAQRSGEGDFDIGPWIHLRRQLNHASDADYAAARAVAERARKGAHRSLRCGISYAFSAEDAWSLEDAKQWDGRRYSYNAWLLASLTDAEAAAVIIKEIPRAAADFAFSMVDRLGVRAVVALEPLVATESYKGEERRAGAEALALIETAEAAALMATLAGDDNVQDIALEYATRAPALAQRALADVGAKDKELAKATAKILKSLPKEDRGRPATAEPEASSENKSKAAPASGDAIPGVLPLILSGAPEKKAGAGKRKAAKAPVLPRFFNAKILPRPRLKKSGALLPVAAIERLGALLASAPPDSTPDELAQIREACEPSSLADFAWEVFSAWEKAGAPKKEIWALSAVGHFGGDESAVRLAPEVAKWPAWGAHGRADVGLAALALIGTTVSLRELWRIAEKTSYPAFQRKARAKLRDVAKARGMMPDELADWLVPDLGLDANGTKAIVVGKATFHVGFDEHLRPYVRSASGERLADLPKPKGGAAASADKEAVEAWHALKREVKSLFADHRRRLEKAMCACRRWDAASFRGALVDHPLLMHLARGLVWGVYRATGALADAFRVAEDRTFAGADDATFSLPDGVSIGIVHPLELSSDECARWSAMFGDYTIVQPFPQLGREVYRLSDAERKATSLKRFEGRKVGYEKVLGLNGFGWRAGKPQSRAMILTYHRELPGDGGRAELALSPGLWAAEMGQSAQQTLGAVSITREDARGPVALGKVDAVIMSELLRELTAAFG